MEEKFLNEIICGLKQRLGEEYELESVKQKKNNGITLTGVSIKMRTNSAGKVFYLDSYFLDYQRGELTVSDIVKDIATNVVYSEYPDGYALMKLAGDYDCIKDKIRIKLVNYKVNREMLSNQVHESYLDLAAVAYVLLGSVSGGMMTMQISHKILKLWGKSEQEVYQTGLANTFRDESVHIEDMKHILLQRMNEITGYGMESQETEKEQEEIRELLSVMIEEVPRLYVATNKEKHYGAVALMDIPTLQKFADEKESDLIIYPCSLHEVLLQPETDVENAEIVPVKEVNNSSVPREDQLSNSVYLFKRDTGTVSIFREGELLEA